MPRKPLVLCLAILGEVLVAAAGPAGDPLALALSAPAGPGRMDGGPCGWTLPPTWFADGQTAMTVAAWCRYEAPPPTEATRGRNHLMAFATLSDGPARATLEGGPQLEGFVDLAEVPLSADGTWGLADAVPQDAGTQARVDGSTFAAICVNLDTDGPATLLVGGSEVTVAGATNLVRNLAVDVPGDPSVSLAALPGARVRLGLAVNPWVRFVEAVSLTGADAYGTALDGGGVTNSWGMYYFRVAAAPSGAVSDAGWITRAGFRMAASGASPGWRPCRDARLQVQLAALVGTANSAPLAGCRYLRMTVSARRNGATARGYVQLSEIELAGADGSRVPWPEGTTAAIPSEPASASEGAGNLVDGSVSTKCCTSASLPWAATIDLGAAADLSAVRGWRWYTANDQPVRDPESFSLSASADGETWTVLDSAEGAEVPTARKALAYEGAVPGPTPRRCEAWGFKRWDGWLPDAALWRVWELDLAELRRRGLDAPLPLGH